MSCALCQKARPRRFCPGVKGDICAVCCGTEREVSVSCPLDCEYLREARKHEEHIPIFPPQLPNQDIKFPESFMDEHADLADFLSRTITSAAFRTAGAVDLDVREALSALVRTYRTMESGLYYESRPTNPVAAAVFDAVQAAVAEIHRREQEGGISRTRSNDVLGVLVFLERVELTWNNGRPRSRAFLDLLRSNLGADAGAPVPPPSSSLIIP